MPLPAYGVLVGTLSLFTRDSLTPTGSFRHGALHVDTPVGQYECAVDVLTPSGIKVQYRLIHRLNHLALTPILRLPAGWQPLASTRSSGALDYVRSPFVGIGMAASSFGFWLFRRDSLIGRFLRWLESLRTSWIDSTGDNALNALETQLLGSVRVFVFGAPSATGLGDRSSMKCRARYVNATPSRRSGCRRIAAPARRSSRARWRVFSIQNTCHVTRESGTKKEVKCLMAEDVQAQFNNLAHDRVSWNLNRAHHRAIATAHAAR
jgi:Uncharacterized conserved protein (DUF2278)